MPGWQSPEDRISLKYKSRLKPLQKPIEVIDNSQPSRRSIYLIMDLFP
jgi:hypothetical protein